MDDSEWLSLAPDDRHRCADCFHLVENQGCFVAISRKQRGIKAKEILGEFPARQYFPDPQPLRRCEYFNPKNDINQHDTNAKPDLSGLQFTPEQPKTQTKRQTVRGNHEKTGGRGWR